MSNLNPRSDPNAPQWHIDVLPAVAAGLLSAIGVAMVFSASRGRDAENFNRFFMERQMMWVMVGVGIFVLASFVDYRFLYRFAPSMYAGSIGLLVAVAVFGDTINGAKSWFAFGSFSFQPSEPIKVALIVTLAWWISRQDEQLDLRSTGVAVAIVGLPVLFLVNQPDIGTAMVYVIILGAMLLIGGARLQHLVILVALAATGTVLAMNSPLLRSYQKARLEGFFNPANASLADRWNVEQAQIAIGNGGLTGLGYGNGTQTASGLVPEQQTDFIFTVVGEELGFVGGTAVLALFGLLLWRLYRTCVIAGDRFGALIATGVLAMITFQMFQAVGMTMGLMPVTGIPLPFLSYGGSSAITSFSSLGLVASIHMRRYMAAIDVATGNAPRWNTG